MSIGVLGSRLRERAGLGFLIGSAGDLDRVHRDGSIRQRPHHISSLDIFDSFPSLSTLSGTCLRSRLCLRLVVEAITSLLIQ